jgi:hypothetical protein
MTAATTLSSPWSEPSVSEHETARAQLEAEQHADQRRAAVLVIAGAARDTSDARTLLDMLGLGLDDIRAAKPMVAVADEPAAPTEPKGRKRSAA